MRPMHIHNWGNDGCRTHLKKVKKLLIGHYKKARAIFNLVGMKDKAQEMDTTISVCTKIHATNDEDAFSTVTSLMLQNLKNEYEQNLTNFVSIQKSLYEQDYFMHKCSSVLTTLKLSNLPKVATASHQVHGPHHKYSVEVVLEFNWGCTLKRRGVKSALVKPTNFRIAFELPSKD